MAVLFRLHGEMERVGDLYFKLRTAGVDAHLETRVRSRWHRSCEMRADIAVLVRGQLRAVAEVKRDGKPLPKPGSRQHEAYSDFSKTTGIKVFYVNDDESALEFYNWCVEVVGMKESA